MDLAGRDRRGERLGIHAGEHQHASVARVLGDGRDEAIRAEADRAAATTVAHATAAGDEADRRRRPPPSRP